MLIDIDECVTDTDDCSHFCFNNIGSYTCDCELGFMLDENQTTCIGMMVFPLNKTNSIHQFHCM